jgi:quinol monooxygenase YgiN
MHALTGYLDFPPERRDETLAALKAVAERSRQDDGCVEYWWSEDVEHPNRFRFFECWESVDAFNGHQDQPYEKEFMSTHVPKVVGADANVFTLSDRRSAMGS